MHANSANQQRLISRIVLTSHAYAFSYLSILATAACVACWYSDDIVQPLLELAVLMSAFAVLRLGSSSLAKLKAHRFE